MKCVALKNKPNYNETYIFHFHSFCHPKHSCSNTRTLNSAQKPSWCRPLASRRSLSITQGHLFESRILEIWFNANTLWRTGANRNTLITFSHDVVISELGPVEGTIRCTQFQTKILGWCIFIIKLTVGNSSTMGRRTNKPGCSRKCKIFLIQNHFGSQSKISP